jgi:hypothetical protein
MKKVRHYLFFIGITAISALASSCSGSGDDPVTEQIVPSNLIVSVEVLGVGASNLNGDGSGIVNFTASATKAVNYGFKFGNELEIKEPSGTIQHTFTTVGTNAYNVTVTAYSSTDKRINVVKTVTVYVQDSAQQVLPSNLLVNIEVIGVDNNKPYGDGSGTVNFSATAADAVSYGFIIDGQTEQLSANGNFQHVFNNKEGIDKHEITVKAYSSTNNFINKSETIPVSYYIGKPPFWADEFFENGTPNSANWNYNLGAGGWGNQEVQTYTSNSENVIVENGVLKITAKSNGSGGYTSARIKSENLFEFTYGIVEVRAKLPAAQGTWPAIWMLGANFDSVGWPTCGEIDIMEQKGWDKNKVLGTCHWSNNGNYAGYGLDTTVSNTSSSFHIYKLEWTEGGSIKFFVDNQQYFVMTTNASMPFNKDFFLILNVAMGGTLGGTIPGNFTQSSMEIDYVRVYQ